MHNTIDERAIIWNIKGAEDIRLNQQLCLNAALALGINVGLTSKEWLKGDVITKIILFNSDDLVLFRYTMY